MANHFIFCAVLYVVIAFTVDLRLLPVEVLGDTNSHYGYFVSYLYQRLFAPQITSMYSTGAINCAKNCIENKRCFSFNLAVTPAVNGKLLCQLLATDQYNSSENFGPSQEFHFYTTVADPCFSSLCHNGGICRSIYRGKDQFICDCPTGFSGIFCEVCDVEKGWQHYDNTCYKFFSSNKTWDQAKKSCEELGASLLTIHSARENDFVTQTWVAPTELKPYIALRDFQNNGTFTWADNSTVDFVKWSPGEPNYIGFEHCAHILDTDGRWNNVGCSTRLPYICEK